MGAKTMLVNPLVINIFKTKYLNLIDVIQMALLYSLALDWYAIATIKFRGVMIFNLL